ncbi:MAG TPA: lamin tail domain-containing protein [Candidatus Paceibacterota bacterium]|nr:lamin tail domain-containing protein [Candidatus Paceibacterota bacterium]
MVRKVLWYIFIGLVVILILVWLFTGGIDKIKAAATSFSNPFGSGGLFGGGAIQLPWAIPIPQGPDISNLTGDYQGGSQAQTLGNPSAYGNQITISADGASANDPQQEYVVIQNNGAAAIDVTGWSLQSALSGARAYIPRGANSFEVGALNEQTDINLAPGASAVVTSGLSPVGTSFRENECSGYLEGLQSYTPPIQTLCPLPNANLSQAAQYGQTCADFVSSIPYCTFPKQFPSNISPACQSYVQNTFSYNGCVQTHQGEASFPLTTWRIYLGASRELWGNSRDTIRLLDSQGQVVAVTSY